MEDRVAVSPSPEGRPSHADDQAADYLRFHRPYLHLSRPFGTGWFGSQAEAFARLFGTPQFLLGQTAIVGAWIALNAAGTFHFDAYPFILLNLAFSLQAAYAAPLILLAQTRQAERDKALVEADAQHREELARASLERERIAGVQADRLRELLEANTRLTESVQHMASRIDTLTHEIHQKVLAS